MSRHRRSRLSTPIAGLAVLPLLAGSPLPSSMSTPHPPSSRQAASRLSAAAVEFTQIRLKNGLRVLLAEDHAAPVFSIAVIYNAGSRDERKGRTGFAHLFEHLMFKGSANVGPGEHFTLIFENGGTMNGTTDKDRTLYYETLPAPQLDMALFLEADRMRSIAITQANLDNQRSAVKEERRVRFDNQPYGRVEETIDALAYDNFAYAHSVIGSLDDLDAASVEDVEAFFRTYYAPNNAVVAIVGDIDVALCAAKVRRYFESMPAQDPPAAVDVSEAPRTSERRRVLVDPLASLERVDIAYKAAARQTRDDDALGVLAAIVGEGRSSRLYTRVVRQESLATTAAASLVQRRGPGLFRMTATVAPGKSAPALEAAIVAEIERIQRDGVEPWELEKARVAARMAIVTGLQSSSTRAILLAQYAMFHGDARLIDARMARTDAVTAEDVRRAARTYLTTSNRTVVTTAKPAPAVVPTGGAS